MRKHPFFLVCLLLFTILSCQKHIEKTPKSEFEALAFETLKSKMTPEDFGNLDWDKIKIEKLNGEPTLLKIKVKNQLTKLYYLQNKTIK